MISLPRILAVFVLFLPPPRPGPTGPLILHDISRVGHTDEPLKAPFTQRWVYEAPSAPQMAWAGEGGKKFETMVLRNRITFDDVFHVAIVGDHLYFGSSVDGRVFCKNLLTGADEWTFFTDGPVRLAPMVVDGKLYIGSDDGHAYCLDAATGKVIWKLRAGPSDERILARGRMTSRWPVRTGVLVDGGIAYFGAGVFPHENVYLYAVEAATGKVLWKNDSISQQDAGRNDLSPQGYLLATKDTLFVPSGRSLAGVVQPRDRRVSRQTGARLARRCRRADRRHAGLPGGRPDLCRGRAPHPRARPGEAEGGLRLVRRAADDALRRHGLHGERHRDHRDRPHRSTRKARASGTSSEWSPSKLAADLEEACRAHRGEETAEGAKATCASRHEGLQALEAAGTTEARTKLEKAKALVEEKQKHVAKVAESYEPKRADYQAKKDQLAKAKEDIAKFSDSGVKWNFETPHDSALIVAGNTLVVGGKGEVVALDVGERQTRLAGQGGRRRARTGRGERPSGREHQHGKDLHLCGCEPARRCRRSRRSRPPTPRRIPFPKDELSDRYAAAAENILKQSGITKGFCLVLGNEQGRLAYELAKRSDLDHLRRGCG